MEKQLTSHHGEICVVLCWWPDNPQYIVAANNELGFLPLLENIHQNEVIDDQFLGLLYIHKNVEDPKELLLSIDIYYIRN